MTALSLLFVLSAPANAATYEVSSEIVKIIAGSSGGMRFTVESTGTVTEDSETYTIAQSNRCQLDLSTDTLSCVGTLTIDDERSETTFSVEADGDAAWSVDSDLGYSDEVTSAATTESFSSAISGEVRGAIHGWSWPDGETPWIIVQWLLEDLLSRDDVLLYVDGICMNCDELGI